MTAKLGPLLDRAVSVLGATLEGRSRADALVWLALLQQWNARIDLTAARSDEELVDLMLADALVLSGRIPQGARVVDVGAGAGAPGLALSLLRPDVRVTLVEPNGKRASFLRTVVGSIGRADIAILRTRGQTVGGPPTWDVAVSRATLPPAEWLELATKLSVPGGSAWLLLAKEAPPEGERARLAETIAYQWPLTGADRVAARYLVL